MVGRVYRVKDCLAYRQGTLTSYPVLKIKLFNIVGEEFPEEIEAPIDTGFEGSLMLTSDDYKFFSIGELPRDYWRRYLTLAGSIVMRVARAIMQVGDFKLEIYVEAPYYGLGKRLMGREVLNKLILVLDGLRKECCIGQHSSHVS
ncbi:MAG TPA: hypothetical protein ENF55_01925 [Thermoprotei archaeon]|nr:hypothetical protein [Thermoprotei archaeon]